MSIERETIYSFPVIEIIGGEMLAAGRDLEMTVLKAAAFESVALNAANE